MVTMTSTNNDKASLLASSYQDGSSCGDGDGDDDEGDDGGSWSQFHEDETFLDIDEQEEQAATTLLPSSVFEEEQQQQQAIIVDNLPPQLHPAVSEGIRRVSSCYFSVPSEASNSVADLLSLIDETTAQHQQENNYSNTLQSHPSSSENKSDPTIPCMGNSGTEMTTTNHTKAAAAADLLYHDILMNVFTFLDAKSLAAFSETARRPNFEVFYFLQLQLQRSLLVGRSSALTESSKEQPRHYTNMMDASLSDIAGVKSIARLASKAPDEAEKLVRGFLDSNSSLSTHHMPLSHSLAYLRQFLLRHSTGRPQQDHQTASNMASAALVVTLVGAASFAAAGAGAEGLPEFAAACSHASADMIPSMLKLGFVGSLMGTAAKSMTAGQEQQQQPQQPSLNGSNMRERAEQMASRLMEQFRGSSISGSLTTTDNIILNSSNSNPQDPPVAGDSPWTPNPYEHLPTITDRSSTDPTPECLKQPQDSSPSTPPDSSSSSSCSPNNKRKTPTGCVGAYWKAVSQASAMLTQLVKDERAAKLRSLTQAEQTQVASTFIGACSSDESLSVVEGLIQKRGYLDVDRFYPSIMAGGAGGGGGDGTMETCALHTAAFHGSCDILDFLCRGIDEQVYNPKDGGLANVNLQDVNGWTALHFAVMGANVDAATRAVEILANHGADLDVEANNGYTPLQWAVRLQNEQVAQALRKQIQIQAEKQRQLRQGVRWMNHLPRRQHLSAMAKRFFDLVQSQSSSSSPEGIAAVEA